MAVKVYATPVDGFNPDAPAFTLSASIVDASTEDAVNHPSLIGERAIWYQGAHGFTLVMGEVDLPIQAGDLPEDGQIRFHEGRLEAYDSEVWHDFGPALSDDRALAETQIALAKDSLRLAEKALRWWERSRAMATFKVSE